MQIIKLKQTLLYAKVHIEKVTSGEKFTGAYLKHFQRSLSIIAYNKTHDEVRQYIDDIISEYDAIIERLEL